MWYEAYVKRKSVSLTDFNPYPLTTVTQLSESNRYYIFLLYSWKFNKNIYVIVENDESQQRIDK